jgi:hypothetical protein
MTNKTKQTAVEWYAVEMANYLKDMYGEGIINIDILKQAIEMERAKMCDFADCYTDNVANGFNESPEDFLEEYEDYRD